MCLPHSSKALRHRRISHSAWRRAPQSGATGLRNPASGDLIRERGDKVLGEHSPVNARSYSIMVVNDYFPNDYDFLDTNNIFGDMASDANASSTTAQHVFLPLVTAIVSALLVVAIDLDMLPLSYITDYMSIICSTFIRPVIMFNMFIMICMPYLWIKLHRKLLKFNINIMKTYMVQL